VRAVAFGNDAMVLIVTVDLDPDTAQFHTGYSLTQHYNQCSEPLGVAAVWHGAARQAASMNA
jgi:hypothetical protein